MRHPITAATLALCCFLCAPALDLRNTVIFIRSDAPSPEKKAAQMLHEEIAKRTQIRLEVASQPPEPSRPVIAMGTASELGNLSANLPPAHPGADGFRVKTAGNRVIVAGNDARGVLFGAGYLLRHMRMDRQILSVDDQLQVVTAPRYSLRGHQIGYRPKVNTYDGWTPAQFEQYIRDLAIFGANAVELIPPRSDDDEDSPHFSL